jgi:CheY-like chemotaxis protein
VALVPIVFLSGLDDREHRLEGFQVGGDAYLTKPFRIDEVVAQVDALIQMAARLRQARQTLASVPPSGHAMVGNLAQMSVATVLTLIDLERRSGKLEVSSENRNATFLVHAGNMADTSIGNMHMAPIDAFRIVMSWETGKFAFTPAPSGAPAPSGEMISINAVLMEAARLEDEERASGEPSERPSSARMAWRETVLRTNAPPRESVPPSSIQSVESYMPPPPSEAPISQNETVVPGAGMGSDFPEAGPHIEPLPPPRALPPVPPPPTPAAGPPPPAPLPAAGRPPPRIEPPPPPPPRFETAVSVTQPSPAFVPPTFGSPPVPPPPPSSLKPLLPPEALRRSVTPSPRPAITLPKPPITPTNTGALPPPPAHATSPKPGPVTRPTKPSMPIPKTAFGAPMRSLSPTKVKAVVPPPPPSKPPPGKDPTKDADLVESGWSVPPPADDAAKDEPGTSGVTPAAGAGQTNATSPEPRAAPLPPRPHRAGQGGGEG